MGHIALIKTTPYFGIILTLVAYFVGLWVYKKTKQFFLFNPLLVAVVICIYVLKKFHISYETYNHGGKVIEFFLTPTLICFGYYLHKEWQNIKPVIIPILISIILGLFVSMASAYYLSSFTHLASFKMSFILQNVYIDTAMHEATKLKLGSAHTYVPFFVMTNALICYGLTPFVFKIFGIDHPVARGVALGTVYNALGATKALEVGEKETAIAVFSFVLGAILMIYCVPFALKMFYHLNHMHFSFLFSSKLF